MKRFFLFLFSILFLSFLAALIIYTQKEKIKEYAIASLSETIETQTGCRVTFSNIQFSLPMQVDVDQLDLHMEEKCLVSLHALRASFLPWEIWNKGIAIHKIAINKARLYGCPSSSSSSPYIEWSQLPPSLSLKSLTIEELIVDKEFLLSLPDEMQRILEYPLKVEGVLTLDSTRREGVLDLSIGKCHFDEKPPSLTEVTISLSQDQEKTFGQLRLIEPPAGLLSSLYPLPKGYQWNAYIQIVGPLDLVSRFLNGKMVNDNTVGEFQVGYASLEGEEHEILKDSGTLEGLYSFSNVGIDIPSIGGTIGKFALQGSLALSPTMELHGARLALEVPDYYLKEQQVKLLHPKIDCFLTGKLPNPVVDVSIDCSQITVAEYTLEGVEGKISFSHEDEGIEGIASFKGEYQKLPCALYTSFLWKDLLRLSHLKTSFGSTQVQGELELDPTSKLVTGELFGDFNLLEIEKIGFPHVVNGAVSFHAYLNVHETVQSLSFILHSPHIEIEDVIADTVGLSAVIIDPLRLDVAHHRTLIHLTCEKAKYREYQVEKLEWQTCTDNDAMEWPCSLRFAWDDKVYTHLQGDWYATSDLLNLSIHSLSGQLGPHAFALKDPFSFRLHGKEAQFSRMTLAIANGFLTLEGSVQREASSLFVEAEQIPLEIFHQFRSDLPFEGVLNGIFKIRQIGEVASGIAKIDIKEIHLLDDKVGFSLPLKANFNAELKNDTCVCRGSIEGLSPEPVALSLMLPVRLNLYPLDFTFNQTRQLKGNLAFKGALEPILELFIPATGPNMAGQADIAVNLSGTPAHPHLEGYANIWNGSFDILGIGLSFRDIQGKITLSGQKATLASLSGTDGVHGKIKGEGTVLLDGSSLFPFDISFLIEHALLRPSDYAWATANGNLRLHGNSEQAFISGKIQSDELNINIPEQIPELMQTLQVTYVNQPAHVPLPTVYKRKPSDFPLNLDLQLEIPQKGYVNGSSWSSEWNGNVSVLGTVDMPQLHGSCRLIKGDYRFQGKPFEIKEGTITFAGDPEKKTTIYVIASEDLDEITAEIILKGSLKNPALSFRSNPPLPQREILSWILFNQGTSDITSFQGTQLNESITDLNMNDNKPDVLTKIRKGFGVDRLDISRSTDNSNEVSVQVGKYLSRGILVSVNKSVTAEANQVALEAEIAKNVKVKAQVGDDSEGQLQLKWKRDY